MTFSDKDLERLKKSGDYDEAIGYTPRCLMMQALVARLEASERKGKSADELREAGQAICDPGTYSLLEREFELADKAWRKAASKGTI